MKKLVIHAAAVVCGAVVGTSIALSVAPHLWWIGLIVGSPIGYLVIGFRQTLGPPKKQIEVYGWQKGLPWRKRRGAVILWIISLGSIVVPLFVILILVPHSHESAFVEAMVAALFLLLIHIIILVGGPKGEFGGFSLFFIVLGLWFLFMPFLLA